MQLHRPGPELSNRTRLNTVQTMNVLVYTLLLSCYHVCPLPSPTPHHGACQPLGAFTQAALALSASASPGEPLVPRYQQLGRVVLAVGLSGSLP